jgi:hypothetical protein
MNNEQLFEQASLLYDEFEKSESLLREGEFNSFEKFIIGKHLVVPLCTRGSLVLESKIQHHCVKNYAHLLNRNDNLLISIRSIGNHYKRTTLHLRSEDGEWFNDQHKGKYNKKPPHNHILSASQLLKMLNEKSLKIDPRYYEQTI